MLVIDAIWVRVEGIDCRTCTDDDIDRYVDKILSLPNVMETEVYDGIRVKIDIKPGENLDRMLMKLDKRIKTIVRKHLTT